MGRHLSRAVTKVVALPDVHLPHNICLASIEAFMADFQPDILIYLGDFMNLDPVSHWIEDKKRLVEGKRLMEEYRSANSIISLHRRIVGEQCKFVYLEGNHENWIEQYVDRHPEIEDFIEYRRHIKNIDLFVDLNNVYKVGKLNYMHGVYTNEHHAKKTAQNYGQNIIYGHTHDIQEYTLTSPMNQHSTKAKSIGCLCDFDLPYMKHKPHKWVNAFNVAYVREDGNFNEYTVNLVNNHFTFNGKSY